MLRIAFSFAVLTIFAAPASAADPAGEWRVEDGRAHIRTALCAGQLWGVISWSRTQGTDAKNPDPALRNRPTIGLPIVLGMKPVEANRWEGSIYNAENGKTYDATITLKRPDVLEIEGCVLGGWLCSGQDWTRVAPPPPANVGSTPGPDLCLKLSAGSQRAHEGRPK